MSFLSLVAGFLRCGKVVAPRVSVLQAHSLSIFTPSPGGLRSPGMNTAPGCLPDGQIVPEWVGRLGSSLCISSQMTMAIIIQG